MPIHSVNHIRLHTVEKGDHGPALVFLHGLLLGNCATWFFSTPFFKNKERRIRLYDLRGHGKSDIPPTGYDLATMKQDLGGLLEVWKMPKTTLVGHSYGALLALSFAIEYPERVERLVLVEPPFPLAEQEEMNAFLALNPEEMVEALPPVLQNQVAQGGRRARRLLERFARLTLHTTLLADLREKSEMKETSWSHLSIPTLVISGSESSCLSGGKTIADTLPQGIHQIVQGGHYLPSECGPEISRLIQEFIDA